MAEINFYKKAKRYAKENSSLYNGGVNDRDNLFKFLEWNEWFGLKDSICFKERADLNTVVIADEMVVDELLENLVLWFAAYKRTHSEKLGILAEFGRTKIPLTTDNFLKFIEEKQGQDEVSSWRLLDFMLFHLKTELPKLDTEELEELAQKLDIEATREVSILFSNFNHWLQKKLGINGWGYYYEYRKKKEPTKAYSLKDFSVMAYCVFNEEHWKAEHMLQKACDSPIYANLWAFIAMHFVCALRTTDIIRIPKPELPGNGENIRQNILEGTFCLAEYISEDIQIRFSYSNRHPHKTLRYGHVPELKVFIPKTLEKPLGIILAIAASHNDEIKPGESFIRVERSIPHTRSFFGEAFMEAIDGKRFSSARANKSYLQGLEMTADEKSGKAKGYMLAALARSHKGGIGKLPDTTDIYLKDASFSGYSPEFIAREMFERGVFGFVPHLLLDVYAGKAYSTLPIKEQTALIRVAGIAPSRIESLVRINDAALQKAKNVVSEITAGAADCGTILQRIASGEAVGKQKESLCIMTACGYGCKFIERSACIGCRYEIHTKAILQQLASEYSRMKTLTKTEEGWRYTKIIRETILPIIGEYLETVKEYSNQAEMQVVAGILEGGLFNYDNGSE